MALKWLLSCVDALVAVHASTSCEGHATNFADIRLFPNVGAPVDAPAALVSKACVATKKFALKLFPACVQALLVFNQIVHQAKTYATAFKVALEWLFLWVGELVVLQVLL